MVNGCDEVTEAGLTVVSGEVEAVFARAACTAHSAGPAAGSPTHLAINTPVNSSKSRSIFNLVILTSHV